MLIKPTITTLLALAFIVAGLGVLVVATMLWGTIWCALLAVAAPGRPLPTSRAAPLVDRAQP